MGIGLTLALVVVFVIVMWAATSLLGFEMALVSSLVISLGLTLLLNLVLGAFRRRRRG
jgi:fucose permease